MKVMLLSPETLGSARVKIAQLSIESRYPIDGQEAKVLTRNPRGLREFVDARMGRAPKEPLRPLFWSDPPEAPHT